MRVVFSKISSSDSFGVGAGDGFGVLVGETDGGGVGDVVCIAAGVGVVAGEIATMLDSGSAALGEDVEPQAEKNKSRNAKITEV